MRYDANHALLETELPGVKLVNRGKVRDVYDLGDALLFVATDRLSAFDVVMPCGIRSQSARSVSSTECDLSSYDWISRTRVRSSDTSPYSGITAAIWARSAAVCRSIALGIAMKVAKITTQSATAAIAP